MHTPRPLYPAHHSHHAMHSEHHHHGHGFCHSCCHPVDDCCCGHRECRKEPKELLVSHAAQKGAADGLFKSSQNVDPVQAALRAMMESDTGEMQNDAEEASAIRKAGIVADTQPSYLGQAFIGGGCCVHLSVEYTPNPAGSTAPGAVVIMVVDSEQTVMLWGRLIKAGSAYTIKECVISTRPGATLRAIALNATARVRWCEVFSC